MGGGRVAFAIAAFLVIAFVLTLWRIVRRRAREARARERVQAAAAQAWRRHGFATPREREQFDEIARDMPEMGDVARRIEEQFRQRRIG